MTKPGGLVLAVEPQIWRAWVFSSATDTSPTDVVAAARFHSRAKRQTGWFGFQPVGDPCRGLGVTGGDIRVYMSDATPMFPPHDRLHQRRTGRNHATGTPASTAGPETRGGTFAGGGGEEDLRSAGNRPA